jgi:hypothetical protein
MIKKREKKCNLDLQKEREKKRKQKNNFRDKIANKKKEGREKSMVYIH